MPTPSRRHFTLRRALAALFLALAAAGAAEAQAPFQPQDEQPAQPPAEPPAPQQPASRVAPDAQPELRLDVADAAQALDAPADGEPTISFEQFAEPVALSALIDFVSETLGENIIVTDTGLEGATVEFSAPIEAPVSDLLSLLETLLTPRGYALVRSPEGFFLVTPVGELSPGFEGGARAPTRIHPTPLIMPSALQQAISSALGSAAQTAKIVYLDELGVIISTASPRINIVIAEVIERITSGLREMELFRFDLDHIAAAEARDRILEISGQLQQGADGQGQRQGGAGATLGNLYDRMLLDRPTNALILRGSEQEAEHVRELVEVVDVPSRLVVRRYFAGPTSPEIARVGERQGLGPIVQSTGGGPAQAREYGSAFVLGGTESGLFTYYGTEAQHQQVEALVEAFAEQASEETLVVEFYKLQHVGAEDTAELINSLLELETAQGDADSPFLPSSVDAAPGGNITGVDRLRNVQQPPAEQPPTADAQQPAQPGEEATITPTEGIAIISDQANNQLIIRAPVRQQREFKRIIERIDRRRPQVYLEVQIVSVSASTDFDLTFDVTATDPDSDVPLFTNFGLRDVTSAAVPTALTGVTAAVIDSDYIPIIVNALEQEGDGRIVSKPRILVNDNETAALSSTRDEPFSQVSQVAGAPTTTGLGGTLSAGTILDLTPSISAGGFLRLEISIELSSFGERPNPDLPPVVNADSFQSVITVPSDSTVVVGGLIFESKDFSRSFVPWLGDIPLLGTFLSNTSRMESRRTVYAFITPRILRDPAFSDLRLLARGPLESVGLETDTPTLKPAYIPIHGGKAKASGAAAELEFEQ